MKQILWHSTVGGLTHQIRAPRGPQSDSLSVNIVRSIRLAASVASPQRQAPNAAVPTGRGRPARRRPAAGRRVDVLHRRR